MWYRDYRVRVAHVDAGLRAAMTVPDAVRMVAERVAPGWLAALPGLVAELAQEWSMTVVGEPLGGGTRSYVTRVRAAQRARGGAPR